MATKIYHERFCVYAHSINGKVFYVGKGVGYRPFISDGRNTKWLSIVRENGSFDVEIVKWFDCGHDAMQFEAEMIERLQPEGNIRLVDKETPRPPVAHDPNTLSCVLQVRVPDELSQQIREIAAQNEMTVSDFARFAISDFISHCKKHGTPLKDRAERLKRARAVLDATTRDDGAITLDDSVVQPITYPEQPEFSNERGVGWTD